MNRTINILVSIACFLLLLAWQVGGLFLAWHGEGMTAFVTGLSAAVVGAGFPLLGQWKVVARVINYRMYAVRFVFEVLVAPAAAVAACLFTLAVYGLISTAGPFSHRLTETFGWLCLYFLGLCFFVGIPTLLASVGTGSLLSAKLHEEPA